MATHYLQNEDVLFIGTNMDHSSPKPRNRVLPAGGAVITAVKVVQRCSTWCAEYAFLSLNDSHVYPRLKFILLLVYYRCVCPRCLLRWQTLFLPIVYYTALYIYTLSHLFVLILLFFYFILLCPFFVSVRYRTWTNRCRQAKRFSSRQSYRTMFGAVSRKNR